MKDKNGVEIRTGDTVRINGAYFKNSNGVFVVTSCPGDPHWSGHDVSCKRLCKSGELSGRRDSVEFWPLSHYCSDSRKNAAAREHDKECATIEVISIENTGYISEYFRDKAEEAEQRANFAAQRFGEDESSVIKTREIAAFYKAVAERTASANTEQTSKKAEPQPAIKFYYNGIRINGDKKLIPVFYSLDNNADHSPSVSISARDYEHLPREFFDVTNNSDPYTDYFDSDRTELRPDHPLYKYARYAAERAKIKEKESRIKYLEDNIKSRPAFYDRDYYKSELEQLREQVAELKAHKNPGQPKAEDIEKIKEMRLEEENRRKAEQQAEQQRAAEERTRKRNEGKKYIEDIAAKFPLSLGAPCVTINRSESPYFSAYGENELKLSVKAADIILRHFDEQRHAENVANNCGGYDKTSFLIEYVRGEDAGGYAGRYAGRYDLGDNEGGLIAHIKSFTSSSPIADDKSFGDFTDYLSSYVDDEDPEQSEGKITVTLAPWVEDRIKKEREEADAGIKAIMFLLSTFTADQLVDAIERTPSPDVAAPFVIELMKKDIRAASAAIDRLMDKFGKQGAAGELNW